MEPRNEKAKSIDSEAFKKLSETILKLFEIEPSKSSLNYEYIKIIGGTVAWMLTVDRCLRKVIGEISQFHVWLRPKLDEFFENFFENFHMDDDRLNTRRFYPYESLILKNGCKNKRFKKKMVEELHLDMCSMLESKENDENRRIIFLNCIKNFVYRTFGINKNCTP